MNLIWAPWRSNYLSTVSKKKKGCLFCGLKKKKGRKQDYVFLRWEHCYAVLNLYPYNNGHVLIVPYRHLGDPSRMSKAEAEEFMQLQNYVRSLLDEVLKPEGYNIGINIGHAAGAGIPKHVHMHIVPRWKGDVNFMPIVGKTKVVSQSLDELFKALVAADKKRKKKC